MHGPRASYAYAWERLALTAGAGAELTSRAVEVPAGVRDERLSGAHGRAGAEVRLPVGRVVVRAGAGARVGILVQSVTARDPADVAPGTKSGLVFGPEVVAGARWILPRGFFADLAATGALSFVREDEALRGIASTTAAGAFGASF